MRITQSMITRGYMSSINSNLENLSKANDKISTGRRFTRVSENVADGVRALQVRQQMDENYQLQLNVRDAQGVVDTAWDCMRTIQNAMIRVKEKVTYGLDDGHGDQRREVALELRGLQEEMVNVLNTQFSGSFIFGGTNNKEQPFKVHQNGYLTYNGVDVDNTAAADVPNNGDLLIDLGMGYKVDMNGNVDPRTGFKVSFDGFEIFGNGMSAVKGKGADTYNLPNNYYNLVGEIAEMFEDPALYDPDKASAILDHLETRRTEFSLQVTQVDSRAEYLETTMTRLENEYDNLTKSRSGLEGINDYEAVMQAKMFEYCWYATLKMGSKVLPQSLMDFVQ